MSPELERALAAVRDLPKRARRPEALRDAKPFRALVDLLVASTDAELLEMAKGPDVLLASGALEALARRDGAPTRADALLALVDTVDDGRALFLLRALDRRVHEALVQRLLERPSRLWLGPPMTTLRGIVADRMRRREPVTLDIDALGDRFGETAVLVSRLADALPAALVEAVRAHKAVEAAAVAVSGIGRIWRGQGAEALAEGIVADDAFTRDVDALHAALTADPPRPQLLVGAAGTGRTARLLALGARLARQGWVVLEAAAAEVNAGQTYVGQLDKRVGQLMDALAEHRILWIVPSFEELRWTGTYRDNPTGILDMVLHRLERRPVCIAGEIEPGR